MKLHALPSALTFSASTQAQRLSGTSKVDRDSVRFGSAPIKLATVTAEEIAKFKSNPIRSMTTAIHEWGHGVMASLQKYLSLDKITITSDSKNLGYFKKSALSKSHDFNELEKAAPLEMAAGKVIEDLFFTKEKRIADLMAKKITPKEFYVPNGGTGDYKNLLLIHDMIQGYHINKSDSFMTKLNKTFKKFFSSIRGWLNPHNEYKLITEWTKQSHQLLKSIPEEGLFRLAKTLEQHGTIEGHETIQGLIKEALGKHYDTLQKQFNTLVAS
jgi:hypothetical protein